MAKSTLIRDVSLFTPEGIIEGDCFIDDQGKVAQLGRVSGQADQELDGRGRWLWPGVIDAHVHMRSPGMTHKEDWQTGSAAALSGGVTCAFDMPNTSPSTITLEALEAKRALLASQSRINFGLFFGATATNLKFAQEAQGICGLKIFMASSTGDLLVDRDEDLEPIFAGFEGQISVHAEDEAYIQAQEAKYAHLDDVSVHSMIRDPEAGAKGIERAARLANKHGRRLHVLHVSTRAELDALAKGQRVAREQRTGAKITAEICPHHLYLSTRDYERFGTFVQMNPPLREEEERVAMWEALAKGRFDLIATDHAPHLPQEKRQPYRKAPAGVPGIELMLPLMLDAVSKGGLGAEQLLELLCHGPAAVYGVAGRGRLEVGAWGDVVMIDPKMTRTIRDEDQRTRCGWTPFAGMTTTGWPVATWVNGQLAFIREDDGVGHLLDDVACGVSAF